MGDACQAQRKIFGLSITGLDAEQVVQRVIGWRPTGVELVVTPNIDHIVNLRRDTAFARAYRSAAIVVCDGFPVRYYAALCGIAAQHVTGVDILQRLMAGFLRSHRLFFVVDSDATAMGVHDWGRRREVAVQTAVPPAGFEADETRCLDLARQIREHGTSILIMGIGAPKSEIWVDTFRAILPPCWALCVGQGTRIACGVTRRAPAMVRRLNCEWLWRVCHEPRRLWRRYLRGLVVFPLAIVEDQADHWLCRLAWRQAEASGEHAGSAQSLSMLANSLSSSL